MKTLFYSVMSMALVFLIASCVKTIEESIPTRNTDYQAKRVMLTKSIADNLSQGVTKTDVEDYLAFRMSISMDDVKDITRFDIDETAYVFVVNMNEGGWFLCSGDYSSVPIIAYRESGSLDLTGKLSPHTQAWLKTVRDQIVNNRNLDSETARANRNDWIKSKQTRLFRDGEPDTGDVQIVISTEVLRNDYYPGLTETTWDQGYPYNNSLPKINTTTRCVAGCAVVALSQLLYYTHFAFGFPSSVYSSATCDDYYNDGPPYSFVFSGPSTSVWNSMPLSYDPNDYNAIGRQYVSALYAQVANRFGTEYTPEYGNTRLDSIPGTMANFLLTGVSYPSPAYNKNTIITEIEDDRPVMCSGANSPTDTIGHTFLIDGYKWNIIREIESFYDMDGQLIDQNINIYNTFLWRINTGDSPTYSFWTSEDYYYSYQRKIHIGWTQ